jgi:5'-nucleotidase/UDP-sugar diphosphatase
MRTRRNVRRLLVVGLILTLLMLVMTLGSATAQQPTATEDIKITVLHTNDEHGWLQTFVAYGSPITEGGAANLMGRFTQIEGYSPDAEGFLLLSAGDNWTGPSISTWFEGKPVVEVMNVMGYDVSVIGNHEFDFGRDALNERIAEADFPFLSANIYYTGTTQLADFVTPYIIEEVNGVNVGIVGLTTVSTAWTTHPKNITDLYFGDYEEALRREVPNMRAEGAELIIVEAHVCSSNLVPVAEAVGDLDIALMQGGHCHDTFTGQVGDTLIIEAHWAMRAYGKTELFLDPVTHDVVDSTQEVIFNQYVTEEGNPVTPDPEVQAIVDYWQERTDEVMGEVIGYTEAGMPRQSWKQANYVTDSWLWAYGTADFAMTNWGGFRADIPVGDITVGDIVGVLPFENRIMDCVISGAQVVENLEIRHAAVAGFTYTYHEEDGETVIESVTLADGSPLDMDATYHVLINDFMYLGGDGYLFYQQDPNAYDTGIQWRQPVIDWTKAQNTSAENPIDPLIDDQPRATRVYPTEEVEILSAISATGYVRSLELFENHFGSYTMWAGQIPAGAGRGEWYGTVQFDLSDIPSEAVITSAEVELTGASEDYQHLNPVAGGEWNLKLLPSHVDLGWLGLSYWDIAILAGEGEAIGPTLSYSDLGTGVVNTFTFSQDQVGTLTDRLGTTGKASFRMDYEAGVPVRVRDLYAWDTTAPPVLRVTYYVP